MSVQLTAYILLVLAGLPLLAYPFVLLANVMSLAATRSPEEAKAPTPLTIKAFLWSSTAYPLVYILFCMVSLQRIRAGKSYEGLEFAIAPILLLLIILWLFYRWTRLDKPSQPRGG